MPLKFQVEKSTSSLAWSIKSKVHGVQVVQIPIKLVKFNIHPSHTASQKQYHINSTKKIISSLSLSMHNDESVHVAIVP